MSNIKKVFDELNKKIQDDNRFLTVLTNKNNVTVIDFKEIKYIEIDLKRNHIWIGANIYINYENVSYEFSIEEFYANLVQRWIEYKKSV